MGTVSDCVDEEYSVIKDKGDIGFIDHGNNESVCDYNPSEEGPVVISVPFPFTNRKPKSVFVGEMGADPITITNTTAEPIELWGVRIYASNPENSFSVCLMEPPSVNSADPETLREYLESFSLEDRVLQPGKTLTVWLACMPKEIGQHTTVVHFDVGDDRIERVVFLLAEDKVSLSLLSSKPYSKGVKKKTPFPLTGFVPGTRPPRKNSREPKCRLPLYPIPKDIRDVVEKKETPDAIKYGLSRSNYASFFKTLLVMEEIRLEEDMRSYDMECVSMKSSGSPYLILDVPGLAEKRPSIVHNDFICVRLASESTDDTSSPYQGFVHRVEADQVFLKFDPGFHACHRDGNLYNVQFTYNRLIMRKLYQSVEASRRLDRTFLFPSESHGKRTMRTSHLSPISPDLNEEQLLSVRMILGCRGGPPYVIHGPPGTGKTKTIVEAVLQIRRSRPDSRVLVCAPSNHATDHIMDKLLSGGALDETELLRLNAATRSFTDVGPDRLRFCSRTDDLFAPPPLAVLLSYRIVVSTYMTAALLYSEGVDRGHFSHIILDEAGQASEPETMIPISHLCGRDTVVVLAGDPLQLGPVVYSKEAETFGLGKSYLERLFECDFYCYGDDKYVTKLVRNYRCHPEILHLPSALFYKGDLVACKPDVPDALSASWSSLLPRPDFPLLFVGIQGCDEREGNNPSWFNRIEVSKVVDTVTRLTAAGHLVAADIGIITPYRQQVTKIQLALERLEIADIKVGSVEQFQGQEREVIIVSTVRSTIRYNEFDRVHCLGFLSNPRRFNVAITRARSLLIIIGNPHIISEDMYWNKLLWRCSDNESYVGCKPPDKKAVEPVPSEDVEWAAGDGWEAGSTQPEVVAAMPGAEDSTWSAKPVTDEAEWSAKPSTDEAEWSDGWRE